MFKKKVAEIDEKHLLGVGVPKEVCENDLGGVYSEIEVKVDGKMVRVPVCLRRQVDKGGEIVVEKPTKLEVVKFSDIVKVGESLETHP